MNANIISYMKLFPSEKSATSHSITWRNAISVKPVEISGANAFAVSGSCYILCFALLTPCIFVYFLEGLHEYEDIRLCDKC